MNNNGLPKVTMGAGRPAQRLRSMHTALAKAIFTWCQELLYCGLHMHCPWLNYFLSPIVPATLQVFIADDPERDVPRRGYVTPEALLCGTCQLPECKPGCPSSAIVADTASADAEAPAPRPAAVTAGPLAMAVAADEAALSEGRSSEDSVLLGLPSPKDSVLPLAVPEGATLQPMPAGSAASGATDMLSGGNSPAAEPRAKLARLGFSPRRHTVAGQGRMSR